MQAEIVSEMSMPLSPQEAEIQATMGNIQSRLMADKGAKHFQPQETANSMSESSFQ